MIFNISSPEARNFAPLLTSIFDPLWIDGFFFLSIFAWSVLKGFDLLGFDKSVSFNVVILIRLDWWFTDIAIFLSLMNFDWKILFHPLLNCLNIEGRIWYFLDLKEILTGFDKFFYDILFFINFLTICFQTPESVYSLICLSVNSKSFLNSPLKFHEISWVSLSSGSILSNTTKNNSKPTKNSSKHN